MVYDVSRRSKFNTVSVDEVHTNVSQEVIEITSDKLTIILTKHISSIEKSREWQTPLSIFLTIVLVLLTAEFKKSFGVSADTWLAIFIIACALCFLWLIRTLVSKQSAMSIEDFLKMVKKQS